MIVVLHCIVNSLLSTLYVKNKDYVMKNSSNIIQWFFRICIIILSVLPVVFMKDYIQHVKYYISGSISQSVFHQKWSMVIINIVIFTIFMIPLSFRRKVKWSEYGLVGAFFVSLFIEMYGFALCLLFIAKLFSWQVVRPESLVGFSVFGVPMIMNLPMTYACAIIVAGMAIIMIGWITLYRSVKKKVLATGGIYAYSRHPQYVGFIMVIGGWIIGWPTIPTVILGSILIYKYVKVCRNEESEMQAASPEYADYMKRTPFMV